MDVRMVNSLVLAYLGDAIYEEYVRIYLIKSGLCKVNDLQKMAINYVSARKQAYFLDKMIDCAFFSEDELVIIRRARNAKSHSAPKGCDILTYKKATALEAVIGYFKLKGLDTRIDDLMSFVLEA